MEVDENTPRARTGCRRASLPAHSLLGYHRTCRCLILHPGRVHSHWESLEEHDTSLEVHIRAHTDSQCLALYISGGERSAGAFCASRKGLSFCPYIFEEKMKEPIFLRKWPRRCRKGSAAHEEAEGSGGASISLC